MRVIGVQDDLDNMEQKHMVWLFFPPYILQILFCENFDVNN